MCVYVLRGLIKPVWRGSGILGSKREREAGNKKKDAQPVELC